METTFLTPLNLVLLTVILGVTCATGAQRYESCGFTNLNDMLFGMIESPTHTTSDNISTYPPNQNCTWNIKFPYDYVNRIELDFRNMSLYRQEKGCDYDLLTYNYPGHFGVPFVLCDYPVNNPVILNNTNQVTLTFHSENISDEIKTRTGTAMGFKLQYRAICDEDHVYEVENISESLLPPPRYSPLAGCTFRWRIKEPPVSSKNDLLLLRPTLSTNGWMVQGLSLPKMGVCLPFNNITITYSPGLGGEPQETQMTFQRAIEDECGCRLLSRQCENGGQCINSGGRFICDCKSPFKGEMCERMIEPDNQHCTSGSDAYPESGIDWSRTRIGEIDIQPCPNATGNATRPCLVFDRVAVWGQPDLSGCVSKLFADIFNAAQLLSQAIHIDQSSIMNITSALTSATTMTTDKKMYAGDLNAATSTLETVAKVVAKTTVDDNGLSNIAKGFGNAVGNIVDPGTSMVWRFTRQGYLENRISSLLESVEVLSANIATKASEILSRRRRSITHYDSLPKSLSATSSNLDFEVKLIERGYNVEPWVFSGQIVGSQIILPDLVLKKAVQRTSDAYIHLYNAKFTSISELLEQTKTMQTNTANESSPVVNSDILSSKVLNVNGKTFTDLTDPIKLVFHLQNSSLSNQLQQQCVFLNMTATTDENRWLQKGCWRSDESNASYTVCYCNHLTNFAVLMDVYGIEESIDELNSKILTYLSYAGGGLSVIGCVLSIIVFEFFRLKNERIRIHEQLAVTIILVQIFFLVGIDRTENRSVCMAMAICLHYFLIAMFCWMLVEGVHLYLLLVRVFQLGSHMKKYIAIGWGIPLVAVGISAGIFHEDYGTGSICWLTRNVLLVAFVPAVGLVIVINTVVLLIVMRIMVTSLTKGSKASSEDKSSVRIGLKAAAVLLPLLGLTWTFGFLSITSDETLIFTYLFTLFNSTQGVFFFVFHCLLSVDVQNAYDRRNRRLSHLRLTESSISKIHSRRASVSGELSKHSTLMSEIASTLERRRSHTNSYSSVGRPQSVTFDDDVFLTQDGPVTRNSFHSNRSSVHSNSNRNSFHDIVRSSPMPAHEKVQGYRNNILNNSSRSRGSVSSDGYLFYYGKDKKQLNENELYDLDKNQLYATVNK